MSKQRKYEFTGKIKTVFGIEFKQIRAIIDFGCIVAGEIGGWIESEDNLSQSGDAWVSGNARVSGNAEVKESCDYMVFGPAGRYNRFTTFFKCKDKVIKVACGCFFGTIIEFREKVKETHKGSKHERVYLAMADMAELQLVNDEVEK